MTDFHKLDSDTRAIALVGRFLQSWAFMEEGLHAAIAKALNLNQLQRYIVTANIQLRDKIHILRTLLHYIPINPPSDIERFDKMLEDIAKYSSKRNMMAHNAFGPSENGTAVQFILTQAKGKLEFPPSVWGAKEFGAAFSKINDFTNGLEELQNKITSAKVTEALMKALQEPIPAPSGLGLASLLHPQPQSPQNLDTSEAIPKRDDETPSSPED